MAIQKGGRGGKVGGKLNGVKELQQEEGKRRWAQEDEGEEEKERRGEGKVRAGARKWE